MIEPVLPTARDTSLRYGPVEVFESQTVDYSPYTSVAGKTTYRLWLELTPDQASVYAMYGSQQNLPYVPATYINMFAMSDGGVAPRCV